jgi:hypothetical protein
MIRLISGCTMRLSGVHLLKMKPRLILIALFVILTLSPVPYQLWSVQSEFQTTVQHDYSQWQNIPPKPLTSIVFGGSQDCLVYAHDSVKIEDCQGKAGSIKWESPVSWNVTEAISADLNRDGKNELVMVVWRPHKNWPIDSYLPSGGRISSFHDRNGLSCHLILVGWDGKKYRELWAGSSLIDPIFDIHASDLDNDGNEELVALEGKYDNKNRVGNLTVWDWSGFGFRLRTRQQGDFSEFGIVSLDQNVLIMSD